LSLSKDNIVFSLAADAVNLTNCNIFLTGKAGTVPGLYITYNSKIKPNTAILYDIKPPEGSSYKIAGTDCKVYPWFTPDQSDITIKPIYSSIVNS
jgi:hypothetical protein